MLKFPKLLRDTFALNLITSIFDNDAHDIISKKGITELEKLRL